MDDREDGRIRLIWALNAVLVAAAVALFATTVSGYGAYTEHPWPWWILALLVVATERWPVQLEFRRSAHAHSLTDVAVTLALLLATGPSGIAATIVGTVPALVGRRLPPVKLVFNVAQYVLAVGAGYVVAHAIAGPDPAFGPRAWVGVLAGLQVGGLVTIGLVSVAIAVSEGKVTLPQVRSLLGMDALVTATNTSLGLLLAVVIEREPAAAPIFAVPLGIAFFAYRQYVNERQRHEKLEFLYEANRALAESGELVEALEGLLSRAIEAYRAEYAEVVLLAPEDGPGVRTSLSASGAQERMTPVRSEDAAMLRRLLDGARHPVALTPPFDGEVAPYLDARGIRHGMVAQLRGEERAVGLLLLGNRVGVARTFTADDLVLLDTLAANASAALQFDRLEQAVAELLDLQDQLRHQATHDPLTGLANRTLFGEEVRAALRATAGKQTEVAVMFLDLDDFKTINDSRGHAVGDELLQGVAVRLASCVRGDDLVARLGGDEFAILLRDRPRAEEAGADVARRLLRAFAQPVLVDGDRLGVGLSIGVATSEHSGGRAEDLLRDADVAMYQAKDSGKGRVATYDPVMREALVRRLGLREELKSAIADGDLVVQYQPIVDVRTDRTAGLEALVRWNHPVRGRIPPSEFIPLAQETGLIVPLGRHVLEAACRQAAGWTATREGPAPAVQVNLSALELEDDGLVAAVTGVLERTGLEPGRLVLEITETLLMQDPARAVARLTALRGVGVRLALDDFGTGYSSLSHLRLLPLDMVKIAKPFVDRIAVDERDQAFMRLMVELAETVGLTVVAEGVETVQQLQVLSEAGCDLVQGHLFAPSVDDAGPWVRPGRALR